ncbi:MAG: hypothetical protein WAM92_15405 [Mycobacterium sp.]
MNFKQKIIAAVSAVLAAGTIGGAAMALANATPTPAPPPPPPTSQPSDTPDAPEPGEAPDQPGEPEAPGDNDNVQDGNQNGPEAPDGTGG